MKDRADRAAATAVGSSTKSFGNDVFLVHGHDDAMTEMTARFIEQLRLPVTVLREEPNKGRTIIQKFEDHARDAGFAVVLLADLNGPKLNPYLRLSQQDRDKLGIRAMLFFLIVIAGFAIWHWLT